MPVEKSYFKALFSCCQNAYVFFFTLGIAFVYVPWNLDRLNLKETDLGLWLFIFGVTNLISNQVTGRVIVPKIGTKNIIMIGTAVLAFCPYFLLTVNSYLNFTVIMVIK